MSLDEQKFIFDDFSVSDDTTDVYISFNGQNVPFSIKRGLTIRERQKASERAIKRHFTPKGEMVVDGVDDATFSIEAVFAATVKWPFQTRAGKPIPITRENVEKLDPILLDRLSVAIMGIRENLLADQEETVLVPFENKSGEVSSQREEKAVHLI